MGFLKQIEIFNSLPKKQLQKVATEIDEIRYVNQQIVFDEGDTVDGFYVVFNGQFCISKMVDLFENKSENIQYRIKTGNKSKLILKRQQFN